MTDRKETNIPENTRKKRSASKMGIVFSALLLISTVLFNILIINTKFLPTKFLLPICVGTFVVFAICTLFAVMGKGRVSRCTAVIFEVLLIALMIFGAFMIHRTMGAINEIVRPATEIAHVGIYVKTEDPAQSLSDASDYTFGIVKVIDRDVTDATVDEINNTLSLEITTAEYTTTTKLVRALLDGNVEAIILNTAYLDILSEQEGLTDIESRIRLLTAFDIEMAEESTETAETDPVNDAPVTPSETTGESVDTPETAPETEDPYYNPNNSGPVDYTTSDSIFTIYISGIDSRSGLIARSRSDVNILATVNTETKQVLLVSTPRDYYVPLSISKGSRDKLTHAGIYGIDVCLDSLGMLYDMNIDYYFRVNFTGFEQIINALGGITVHSDYAFKASSYTYVVGDNELNGAEALTFARERYAFPSGDRQRGKNQMAVIKAVMNKAMSPDILKNYSALIESLSGCFETNVPYDLIALIIRDQLAKGGTWNVVNYSVDGYGGYDIPYSLGAYAYVMIPNYDTVENAKDMMRRVINGEIIG